MEGVMSPEQLEQLTSHVFQAVGANMERRWDAWWQTQRPTAGKGGGGKGGRAVIEPKYLNRVKEFLGDERSWKDWFASMTTAVIQMYPELAEAMETVALRAESIQDWVTLDECLDHDVREDYEGPLWAVLVQHTGGEARTVVLNQKMKQGKPDGFAALGMLSKRYNPKTPSRILHALTQVLSPPKIKDVRQAPRAVEEWEAAKGKLKIEFGEELSEVVQIAILTGMLQSDLQDKVFEMSNGGELKYHKVRDAIMGIMNNRARVLEPTPMDIGQVGGRARAVGEEVDFWDGAEEEPDYEVDAVGKGGVGGCHRCGGFGHFARVCPTPEGKGKGKAKGWKGGTDFNFKGKGESVKGAWGWYGKTGAADNWFNKGKKGKSNGKGYQGTCWLCGKVGHKAAECGGKGGHGGGVEAIEEEEEVAEVGGIWTIAAVEKEWTTVKRRKPPTKKEVAWRRRNTEMAVEQKNKFEELDDGGDTQETPPGLTRDRASPCGCSKGSQAVCAVEATLQVEEVAVAQVSTEITIDSAAEESVCPQKWAEGFGLQRADRPLKLVNASGGRIEHFGNRAVSFNPENGEGRTMEAKFEVTNVRKPLMAVARVVDAGNVVQFGPRPQDNFIMHVGSKDKVYLRRKGNSFVLKGELAENPL